MSEAEIVYPVFKKYVTNHRTYLLRFFPITDNLWHWSFRPDMDKRTVSGIAQSLFLAERIARGSLDEWIANTSKLYRT